MLFFYSLSNLLPLLINNVTVLRVTCPPDVHFLRGHGSRTRITILREPSLSSLIMLHVAETLSLTEVREAQVEISDVRVLLQFL